MEKPDITQEIRARLEGLREEKNAAFVAKLIPNIPAATVLGLRTPLLRTLAKEYAAREDIGAFLRDLPHRYFDEMQLHAFIVSGIRDFTACLAQVEALLPSVDNWATCDQLSPAVFKKHSDELLPAIRRWLRSDHDYTQRFAVGMLMQHFLDAPHFSTELADLVARLHSEEYYVNMMRAWYFATALAKQYDAILPYIAERRLDSWTHRRAIQKALESRRIAEERKALLRSLR